MRVLLIILAVAASAEAFLQPMVSRSAYRPLLRAHVATSSSRCRPSARLLGWSMGEAADGAVGDDDSEAVQAFRLKKLLKKSSIFLVGMDGCGKDVIGEELARGLGYRFVDTNQIMSQLSGGKPVSDALLAEMGEPVWVQLERQVMDAVQAYMSTVVATGSVAPLDIENWAKFRTGVVVYLSVTEAGLKQGEGIQCGLNGETNALSPGLPEKAGVLPLILAQREARYSQADVVIEVDGLSAKESATKLTQALCDFIKENPAPEVKLSEAHAQALSRIISEEEWEGDREKRPAGAAVPREDLQKLYDMFEKAGDDKGEEEDTKGKGK